MTIAWEVRELGDICEIARGGSPRPIQEFITNNPNGVNWIKISDATASGKYIYSTKEKITQAGVQRSRMVNEGDFILSNSMSFGRPYIMKTSGCIHDGWLVLSDKKHVFDQDYLYYFLGSDIAYRQFDSLAAGSTVRNLNIDSAKKVKVPLPPIVEQKRIAAILDEAFAGIAAATANAEANLANARELFTGYLSSVFHLVSEKWPQKTIGEIAKHSLGKMLDKGKNRGSLQPYLRNLNVRWFEFDLEDVQEMRFEADEQEKYTAIKGDVLICEGGYPGRAAIWQGDDPIYFQKALHRVRFEHEPLGRWFLYFLYLSDATDELRQHFTGAGIQHFTGQALHKFRIPLPPLLTVEAHVEQFDILYEETRKIEAVYRKKVSTLSDLKQAILQKAFSGELTVQPEAALREEAA